MQPFPSLPKVIPDKRATRCSQNNWETIDFILKNNANLCISRTSTNANLRVSRTLTNANLPVSRNSGTDNLRFSRTLTNDNLRSSRVLTKAELQVSRTFSKYDRVQFPSLQESDKYRKSSFTQSFHSLQGIYADLQYIQVPSSLFYPKSISIDTHIDKNMLFQRSCVLSPREFALQHAKNVKPPDSFMKNGLTVVCNTPSLPVFERHYNHEFELTEKGKEEKKKKERKVKSTKSRDDFLTGARLRHEAQRIARAHYRQKWRWAYQKVVEENRARWIRVRAMFEDASKQLLKKYYAKKVDLVKDQYGAVCEEFDRVLAVQWAEAEKQKRDRKFDEIINEISISHKQKSVEEFNILKKKLQTKVLYEKAARILQPVKERKSQRVKALVNDFVTRQWKLHAGGNTHEEEMPHPGVVDEDYISNKTLPDVHTSVFCPFLPTTSEDEEKLDNVKSLMNKFVTRRKKKHSEQPENESFPAIKEEECAETSTVLPPIARK